MGRWRSFGKMPGQASNFREQLVWSQEYKKHRCMLRTRAYMYLGRRAGHVPWRCLTGFQADLSQSRPISANLCQFRPISANLGQSQPIWANLVVSYRYDEGWSVTAVGRMAFQLPPPMRAVVKRPGEAALDCLGSPQDRPPTRPGRQPTKETGSPNRSLTEAWRAAHRLA